MSRIDLDIFREDREKAIKALSDFLYRYAEEFNYNCAAEVDAKRSAEDYIGNIELRRGFCDVEK